MVFKLEQRSKTQQIVDHLRSEIICGKYQDGDKFHSNNSLARKFGVSNITARMIISSLAQEGLVKRINGKGSFVQAPGETLQTLSYSAVLNTTTGHVYGNMAKILINEIQNANAFINLSDMRSNLKENVELFERIIASDVKGILIDGLSSMPFDYLRKQEKHLENLVFFDRYEYDYKFPKASYVLSDTNHGISIAVNHLLERGHKKIALLTHEYHPEKHLGRDIYKFTEHFRMVTSFKKTISERGKDNQSSVHLIPSDEVKTKKYLHQLLKSADRPTAIFSIQDSRLIDVIEIANQLSLKIPQDLALVGYLNTPWASILKPTLTSVSIKEEDIARIAAQKLLSGSNNPPQTILIKPELIIRESS